MWLKADARPCWRVQSALDDAGIEYEAVKEPARRSKRVEIEQQTGQRLLPVIEFEDGSYYRDESGALAERIRAGKLGPQPAGG
jgi:glutaredoxin